MKNKKDKNAQNFDEGEDEEVVSFFYEDCSIEKENQTLLVKDDAAISSGLNDIDLKPIEVKVDDKLILDERSVKTYWTDDTEAGIIDFLFLNEFFYENRIKEEYEDAEKEKRIVNTFYCNDMQRRMEEVVQIKDREERREKIFREKIEAPLKKLVENILFNYKLFLPDIDAKTQQKDCYTFLYLKFANFNPWRRTKSFSFFGTIAKHYFLGNRKDHAKNTKILYDFDSNKEEADTKKTEDPKPYLKEDTSLDLFNFISDSIEQEFGENNLSKNDKKVGYAIIQIFKNHETLGVYNKNQIYQLIKENTGLETKDITYSLHRFRVIYKTLKQGFVQNIED